MSEPCCRQCKKKLRKYALDWWSLTSKEPEPKVGQLVRGCVAQQVIRFSDCSKIIGYGYRGCSYFCSMECCYKWAVDTLNKTTIGAVTDHADALKVLEDAET